MKSKILINGRSQNIVSDFMRLTETTFDSLSTSNYLNDVIGHFRFFQPAAYIVFMDTSADQTIRDLTALKENDFYNGAYIVLVGDPEACNQVEHKTEDLVNLIVRRPISPEKLVMRINMYLQDNLSIRASDAAFQAKTNQFDALIRAAEAAISEPPAAAPPAPARAPAAAPARMPASASAPAAAPPAAATPQPAPRGGKRHILVVDDDRTVLKMLKTALSDRYDVTAMASGSMVDKMLDVKRVDLMILDYEMPVETGAEIFKRLKKNPRAANIPVCFLTGVSDREKIIEVMSLKPNGYILKPIDMDTLNSTIRNIIG